MVEALLEQFNATLKTMKDALPSPTNKPLLSEIQLSDKVGTGVHPVVQEEKLIMFQCKLEDIFLLENYLLRPLLIQKSILL